MWIMLNRKLPTDPSPPKLSIHWSAPWPFETDAIMNQFIKHFGNDFLANKMDIHGLKKNYYYTFNEKFEKVVLHKEDVAKRVIAFMEQQDDVLLDKFWGPQYKEYNYATARKILYKGEYIRVFAEEFVPMVASKMRIQCGGQVDDVSHELVPGDVSSEKIINDIAGGISREFYDAALLDGCSHAQAQLVAMGVEINIRAQEEAEKNDELASEKEFPPIGWYRCKTEYAQVFCHENEMEE